MRLIPGLAVVLIVSIPLSAADTPSSPPTRLDIVVEDSRGGAVETLAPADFSVTEQGRTLPLDGVQFVRAGEQRAGRVVAIYLDEFHVTPGAAAEQARAALIRLVGTALDPSDQLVVLKSLDSLLDIKPVPDRSDAITKLQAFDPRRGDLEPRTPFERNFIAGTIARVETARAQIATSSLEALATELGRLSTARKTLIVVSEGFTRGARRRGDDLLPSMDSVVLAANRARVSIYPFDPSSGEPAAPTDGATDANDPIKGRAAMRTLADGTSGRTIGASADVDRALQQALIESRGYYELTLSNDLPQDGRFHTVDVAVRRPGVSVRARRGYWAASDKALTWRSTLTSPSAIPIGARIARRTSPLIRPWFGISKSADGRTEVSFVWEPAPRVPGDRNPPPPLAQIGLSVMTLDGSPVYQGAVLPSTATTIDAGAARQSRASFISPSGRLVVQMSIEDVTSRVVDHDVRDLEVRGFPGPVSMGSPQVLRARSAKEFQALAADPDASPIASRQFSRAERLLVRIPVFALNGTPTVSARLVSSFGNAMRDLVVTPTPSSPSEFQTDVALAALAAGSYVVELTARTKDGEVRDRVPFRVTP